MLIRIRDSLAVILLGACLLTGTLNHLTNDVALGWFRDTSTRMSSLGVTAKNLRSLGATGEEIGYLADPPNDPAFYYGLQYQMLPSILIRSTAPAFLILRTTDQANLQAHLEIERLVLVGDGGNGFYLLRHRLP